MNQASGGLQQGAQVYGGRIADIPDNMKVLFRPVAMVLPDLEMIAQTLLYAAGFVEAKVLAEKIVVAYRLLAEQLSSQEHYNFGMRAMKATVSAASALKIKYLHEDESRLVFKAISDANKPKVYRTLFHLPRI